ncbi:hypothetical protein [Rhodothermus bifroesti]|uniref:Collagen-like protein n=1 Tax=Rhodothermus marinus TaxID=29549 RepID=A0A7V2AYF7_RHOMR|nr:hypothetical protein [Rhodothermus bifroesti]GBD01699.1 hypothetical protein HRbin18_01426 [bacterium HR18]
MQRVFFWLLAILGMSPLACEGPAGPPGPPGNANVVSFTFTLLPERLRYNGPVASVGYEVPEISASVVEGGAVLVYFYEQGTWTALPYTFAYESSELPAVDFTVTLGYAFEVGFLEIFYEASTEAVDLRRLGLVQTPRRLKVVIIDGFPLAKMPVDVRNYEAVRAYFGLSD